MLKYLYFPRITLKFVIGLDSIVYADAMAIRLLLIVRVHVP